MSRWVRLEALICALAAVSLCLHSCSDETPSGSADGGGVDTPGGGDADGGGEGDPGPSDQGGELERDEGPPDTGPPDVEEEVGPIEEGETGWPCESGDDCNSGYCVETAQGSLCTQVCEEQCPKTWACKQDISQLPDVLFLCLPDFPTTCFPCVSNSDCVTVNDNTPHRCIPRGDEGAFCGGVCGDGVKCPSGYFCATVADVDGAVSDQCVPEEGVCECPQGAIDKGASTICASTNEFGSCQGERSCQADGLTACTATEPALDLCDGQDDDCDGAQDDDFVAEPCTESNDFGTCEGMTSCADGVQGCSANVPAAEACGDDFDNDCDGEVDEEDGEGCVPFWLDEDGDGWGVGESRCLCGPEGDWRANQVGDCADNAKKVNPDAVEACNKIDDDCNGTTDDPGSLGCTDFHKDEDGDGFGDPDDVQCLCVPAAPYLTTDDTDCNDLEGAANPGQSEICDGVDNDCDGVTDEEGAGGCTLYFADGDGDLFGDPADFACLCAAADPYVVTQGGDCVDSDPDINPSLVETCDGIDNDCNGATDEAGADGCSIYYLDGDQDTFGIPGDLQCLCAPEGAYTATQTGDCNDNAASAFPGALEICNAIDDDCDDVVDEPDADGCSIFFKDADLDTFGVPGDSLCLCDPAIPYVSTQPTDCDDTNPFIHPDALEVCNGLDDDCSGTADEGVAGSCTDFYVDADGDGWGAAESLCLCSPDGDYTAVKTGDCNDDDKNVFPLSQELCNGADDDCDGETDEIGALGCVLYFKDEDADTFGDLNDSQCLCAPAGSYNTQLTGDCNDLDNTILPGATEVCNGGIDDDCDGATDESGATGCTDYLRDNDGDTYGVASDKQCLCAPTAPYSATTGGDCNDSNDLQNPGAAEICNGADDDCNGVVDDPNTPGCVDYYQDADGDSYGIGPGQGGVAQCLCNPSGTFTATVEGDCDDSVATTNPGATESCNGKDDDCNAQVDEADSVGCIVLLKDADDDSFGVTGDSQCLCGAAGDYTATTGGDCDDAEVAIFPGAEEVCNTFDDDCDSLTDEAGATGCSNWLLDEDGDTYGVAFDSQCLCAATAPYSTQTPGDCDDAVATTNPGGEEICNGVDDDCNGTADDPGSTGCNVYFRDTDGDGFGVTTDSQCLCGPTGLYTASQGGDCDDAVATTNPSATEQCNGVDDNCNMMTDEPGTAGCVDFLLDADDDGFGVTGDTQCLCVATGEYRTLIGGDCNDGDGTVFPGGTELCSTALDDDCDGQTNEPNAADCVTYYKDGDDDGAGVTNDNVCVCAPFDPYDVEVGGDCDDTDPGVGASASAEVCNGVDDDCDGTVDNPGAGGCTVLFRDADGDTFGDDADSLCLCAPIGTYTATVGGDCNDSLANVNPNGNESCNGADDDCDGTVDEPGTVGCVAFLRDEDGDSFGVAGDTQCLCAPAGFYTTLNPGDCLDTEPLAFPGAVESCNGIDDNCNGATDEAGAAGCTSFLLDGDDDTYGVTGDSQCLCAASDPYDATLGGDCNDALSAVNPAGTEACDGVDNDCNGVIDDAGSTGCSVFFRDGDGDGYGNSNDSRCLCAASGLYTATVGGDCDDSQGTINPGAAEQCNTVDDNCDNSIDEQGAVGCVAFLRDFDGDSFGVTGDSQCLCAPSALYSAFLTGDCNDGNAAVNPAALEICDGIDNNCVGGADEQGASGCTVYYGDVDGDTYGVTDDTRCLCAAAAPYNATQGGDCDDGETAVAPGVTEVCNSIDDNCDGFTDEVDSQGCTDYFRDDDGDGYGVAETLCLCAPVGAFQASQAGDCDDTNPLRSPGLPEVCANGLDDNCANGEDEAGAVGCSTFYEDVDDDTFGVTASATCLCAATGDFTAIQGGDCDDTLGIVNPDELEVCDAVDNECDGQVDEGCGMPVDGWPTHMYDTRRTGHTLINDIPGTPNIRWSTQLPGVSAGWQVQNSPVIMENGDVIVSAETQVVRIDDADGSTSEWTPYTLPATIYDYAGPTLRIGGTIVVTAGTFLVMLTPELEEIWTTDLGSPLVSTPIVDPNGDIYVVSATGLHAVGTDGVQDWFVAAVNDSDTPSHPAIGINGRIYFAAADHKVYSVDPDAPIGSKLQWAVEPAGLPGSELSNTVDSSVAISELGIIYQAFGTRIFGLSIAGSTVYSVNDSAGDRYHSGIAIHNTGYQCCNPEEFLWVNRAGNNRLVKYDVGLNQDGTSDSNVSSGNGRASTPVSDRNGQMVVGSDNGRLWSFNQDTGNNFQFNQGFGDIDGPAAIGDGYIVFGTENRTVHCVD